MPARAAVKEQIEPGLVSIVGAGPGDVGLLTVRGQERIAAADVIVYDALVNPDILPASARENGTPEVYYVGKRGERRAVPQDEVNLFITRLAREGKRVVYLKGGDPFVFGRGDEVAQALHDAELEFEIVPGVTAGVAATAYAGIPVTTQSLATSVTFVTGLDDPADPDTKTDWRALAKVGGTIVMYNGLNALPDIAAALISAGMPADIPAAAIQSGTRAEQRSVVATLGTLAHEAALASLEGAVMIVIGWTVILRDELAWFDTRALFGRRIALVSSAQGARQLPDQLRAFGADVIELPPARAARLDLSEVREDVEELAQYQWIIFTSPETVNIFWEQLLTSGRDTRALGATKVAAIGAATAAALLDRGVTVDVLPERFAADTLIDVLAQREDIPGASVLYYCEDSDDGALSTQLTALGTDVVARPVYRAVYDGAGAERVRKQLERGVIDLVVFTSPASVTQYVRAMGDALVMRAPGAASDTGTAEALRSAGIEVLVESEGAGMQAFAESIAETLRSEAL